ncbi:MAG: PilZ domain-containing protein [Planctomycetes bacterium]|nr:PilZ domain-containing protein [Planctomycetota bacterium]
MANPNEAPHIPNTVLTEQTQLSLPSYPHWIEAAVEYLRQKAVLSGACHESRSGKLMVSLHEALSNAIVHGNLEISSELKERGDSTFAEALAQRVADPAFSERPVDVVIDSNIERCRWVITDQGKGFDVEAVMKKKLSDDPEVLLASGRGMLIMSSFLDDLKYEMGGRRLVLTLRRHSGEEKRRHPRRAAQKALHVAPILADGTVDWDAAYEAVARDFSESGVGLLQERLADTERILIGISVNNRMVYVPAEVRHCKALGGDMVELGCRFQTKPETVRAAAPALDLGAVHQLITEILERHQPAQLPVDERRSHQRVVYNERIEVFPAGQKAPLIGYARDLSKGGMAFITTTVLPADVTLIMLPRAGAGPLRLRSQVVRCVKIQEGFYDVGAKFLGLE